jgi:hypothetical protein
VSLLLVARLTILEALRRRLLWALAFLTFAVVALTALSFNLVVENARARGIQELELIVGVSQLLILVAFMFSFVLAITAAFLGAPAIAGDAIPGVCFRDRRPADPASDVVLGKWRLSAIVLGYSIASGFLELAVVRWITGYGPPDPLAASLYLGAQAIVLLSIALLLSTRVPAIAGGAIAVVLFGMSWMTGVLASVATVLGLDDVARTIEGEPLHRPARRAVARHDLRPRAVGGAPRPRRRRAERRDAGPIPRRLPARAGVPRLRRDLARVRPRPRRHLVRPPRGVTARGVMTADPAGCGPT